MPFEIVRNDIAKMRVDAIVNTANTKPIVGPGTDHAIHAAAGAELLKARQRIGVIPAGEAAITPAFGLDAKYVIHTVGPRWYGGNHQEKRLLRRCYDTALALAHRYGCQSIAFPLISAGAHGFPGDVALQVATEAFKAFLEREDMMIYLVVFNREAFRLSEELRFRVTSYIDEHYVAAKLQETRRLYRSRRREDLEEKMEAPMMAPMMAPSILGGMSLREMLEQTDAGFTETLLKYIDRTGEKDSVIYKRANVSKQHFSKIHNNLQYKPTKETALAFAVALRLNLRQTKDLIGRAGYTLTNSSKFDIIVRYFIENGNYNLYDINATLFEFDQPLLGSKVN